MTGLRHFFHRHTLAARADAGDIVLCHRRSRVDAHIRPAGHDSWTCLHNVRFEELAELLRAADSPHGVNASGSAAERLLFVANAARMRRARAGV